MHGRRCRCQVLYRKGFFQRRGWEWERGRSEEYSPDLGLVQPGCRACAKSNTELEAVGSHLMARGYFVS